MKTYAHLPRNGTEHYYVVMTANDDDSNNEKITQYKDKTNAGEGRADGNQKK
jgi:hypothetical protein